MPTIENVKDVKNAFGDDYKFAERDELGRIKYDGDKNLIVSSGDTCDLVRSLLSLYSEVKWAFWNGDSKPFARVMQAINDCRNGKKNAAIEVADGDYHWLVGDGQGLIGILDRKMPAGERARLGVDEENALAHPTVGMVVWNANESKLRSYLKAE